MKAAVIKGPGITAVEDFPTPRPAEGEVLLKVDACALCGTDQRVLRGEKKADVPIIGHEIAGTVVGLGKGVKGVRLGGRYALQTVIGCGCCRMCIKKRQNLCENRFKALGYAWNGGFAEYMIMPRSGVEQGCLIPIPDSMSAEVASLLEPLSCCVNGYRCMPVKEMEHVVVFGAGTIGVMNGLVAKAQGVKTVTIMNRSQERLDTIRKIGFRFDNLVNMSEVSPEAWVKEHTGGIGVDAVIVSASVKSLVPLGMKLLKWSGHLSIFAGMNKNDPFEPIDLNLIHYPELHIHGANSSVALDYTDSIDLIMGGHIDAEAMITHRFALDDFNEALKLQTDTSAGAMKIVILPHK